MTYKQKKSLYESIMKDVAKIVKRRINEDFLGYPDGDDLISREDALSIARKEDNYIIEGGLDYIESNESMNDYFNQANIKSIESTRKVATMCTDGKNFYYNPEFMEGLSDAEQAYVILHTCAHINMSHVETNNRNDPEAFFKENIEKDRKVNRYLEERWPEFRGMTKKLNGFI